jgi:hypothetical protein
MARPAAWQLNRARADDRHSRCEEAPAANTATCPPLEPQSCSLCAKHVVSDEQIQQWANEAEAGYDIDVLKRRGRGRPGRGAEPMQVVAVRLTAEELDASTPRRPRTT